MITEHVAEQELRPAAGPPVGVITAAHPYRIELKFAAVIPRFNRVFRYQVVIGVERSLVGEGREPEGVRGDGGGDRCGRCHHGSWGCRNGDGAA